MALKELIDKRKDVLFAEIGALIHDLGKLSERFILQACEDNIDFFYDHSLVFARDFLIANNDNKYHKTDEELNGIINHINQKLESGDFSEYKQIRDYIKDEIPEITSNNKANNFITLLKSKESKDELWKSKETSIDIDINIKIEHDESSIRILDLISKHHGSEKNYNPLSANIDKHVINQLINSDQTDSAIDKMVADVSQSKQRIDHTYISTAFGYESDKVDLSSLTSIREDYANKLAEVLQDLKDNSSDFSNWVQKREELLKETKKAFLNALGETRRPANDVTLWDHSFSVASLYKAALVEVVINGGKEPKEIKWKLLSIRFDGDEFYYTVPKIADVLGRKALVEKILDNIKILLEVVIPVGNEIYRDESGSVFLVPDESLNATNILEIAEIWDDIKDVKFEAYLNYQGKWENRELKNITDNSNNLKELIEKISSYMSEDVFIPEIHLSDSSRGALNLGDEIFPKNKESTTNIDSTSNTPKDEIIFRKHTVNFEKLEQRWTGKENNYEKCTVCGLKPIPLSKEEKENLDKKIENEGWQKLSEEEKNQYKAYERKVCIDCLKFSFNRVEEWRKNHFNTSIWLDEIADENNRIALVYLSFDLRNWLNGEMLNTFLSKPIEILKESGLAFDDYESIISHIKGNFNKKDENFWKVFDPHSKDKTAREIFEDIIENRNENWKEIYKIEDALSSEEETEAKAKILLLNLTRKHPSFARLRRIWETMRNFGIDIFEKTKEKVSKRNRIIIEFDQNDSLKTTHTYWFKENGKEYELVVIENKRKAAIISNSGSFKIPKNKKLELYNENFKTHITTITNVTVQEEKDYYPLIPYQFEPTKTLFFMPLKQVWEVIQLIKKEYEIQFNKVQNRLPINIGFVAFHKKTPMYAVLDTAKRMYLRKANRKLFKIKEIQNIDRINKNITFLIENDCPDNGEEKKEYKYHFSYSTGDPEKEDLFHPYFIIEEDNGWKTYVNGDWKTIKHVKYLQKEDKVSFYPSCFDFLWLDTNTRRLDVGEKRIHWLFKEFSPKPYNLKDIESFERLRIILLEKLKLTASQLLNIYGLLISKLEEWQLPNKKLPIDDEVFEGFVKNAILSIPLRLRIDNSTEKGKISQNDFEFLKTTILNGMFFDFIDMWHTILKRKFREDE